MPNAKRVRDAISVADVKDLAQEQLGAFVPRMLEKRLRRVHLDDLASRTNQGELDHHPLEVEHLVEEHTAAVIASSLIESSE